MTIKQLKKFVKERDRAVLSFDVETFKSFVRKWQGVAFDKDVMPSDKVIEISLRKMALQITSATEEQRAQAAEWLLERGYKLDIN